MQLALQLSAGPPPRLPLAEVPQAEKALSNVDIAKRLKKHGNLMVRLNAGANLKAADFTGYSDPYVVARFSPQDGPSLEVTSSIIEQTLNPVWRENNELEFNTTTLEDAICADLTLMVYSLILSFAALHPSGCCITPTFPFPSHSSALSIGPVLNTPSIMNTT